jgi:membrane protein DedA with SNARE-associated domain
MDMHTTFETFRSWVLDHNATTIFLAVTGAVFVGSIIESLPIIGMFMLMQSLTIFLGILAYEGIVDPVWTWSALIAGMVAGDTLGYRIGTRIDSTTIERMLERLRLSRAHYTKIKHTLDRHYATTYLLSRSSGWTRWIVPFLSGNYGIDLGRFFIYNTLTAVLWSGLFFLGGYYLGLGFDTIEKYIFFGIIVLVFAAYAVYRYKQRTRAT